MNKNDSENQRANMSAWHQKIKSKQFITGIGVYDAFSALVVESAGAELLFLGGFGVSASMLGLPDLSYLTMTEMTDTVRRVTRMVEIPVIADGDTGYGGLPQVARTVQQFEEAGAAGILLEDQVFPKRCGHFEEKSVIPMLEMREKLEVALTARQNPEFVIIARTDAIAVEGYQSAVERANCYGEVGADLCFVEAPENLQQLQSLPRDVNYSLMANMLLGGKTPILTAAELEEAGYSMMACPVASLLAVESGLRTMMRDLLENGKIEQSTEKWGSFSDLKQVLGLEEHLQRFKSHG